MSFSDSIRICLQKYIDFNGRATRSEYWWFVLLTFALGFIPVIGWLIRLALLLPSLSVQVRRLHDLGRSAWWLLLLIPPIFIIGGPVLLIMSAFPGTPGPNRYGPDPLAQPYGTGGFGSSYSNRPNTPPPPAGAPEETFPDASLPEPDAVTGRFCTQCGMQLQEGARFCTVCGTAV